MQPAGQDHGRIHLHRRHRRGSALQNPRAGLHTSWSGGLSGADVRWHAHWAGRPPDVSRCLMFQIQLLHRGFRRTAHGHHGWLSACCIIMPGLCCDASTAVDYPAPRYPVSRDVEPQKPVLCKYLPPVTCSPRLPSPFLCDSMPSMARQPPELSPPCVLHVGLDRSRGRRPALMLRPPGSVMSQLFG